MLGPTVGYQGASASYSDLVLRRSLPDRVQTRGYDSFSALGRAVDVGEVDFGLLPLENSLAGTVTASYDVLASRPLLVVAELVMPIRLCLLARPGARLDELYRVASHPVALDQCAHFFESHPAIEPVVAFDTAGAAAQIAALGDRTQGAIASIECAERYGLEVIRGGIQDRTDNQTRFALVTSEQSLHPFSLLGSGTDRAMLRVELAHEPGSLARFLQAIAEEGHNVSKLETRPATTPWTYRFFVELEPALTDGWQARLVTRLMDEWPCRMIGVYARFDVATSPFVGTGS